MRHQSSTMSRFFFSCLFMGAVCGIVGGLIGSADSGAMPTANIRAVANCRILDDLMRILLLSLDIILHVYWLRSLENHEETVKDSLILGLFAAAMSTSASVAKCDQACLDKTVDTDIAAKVAHDPSKVAWAPWSPQSISRRSIFPRPRFSEVRGGKIHEVEA